MANKSYKLKRLRYTKKVRNTKKLKNIKNIKVTFYFHLCIIIFAISKIEILSNL